ncbi:MAG: AAA family ATPase, partial [Candidatus Thermoplasmatota archaeon]|nr:AAA family ATPase [Candidatus Thermoplasmatota archaeon]
MAAPPPRRAEERGFERAGPPDLRFQELRMLSNHPGGSTTLAMDTHAGGRVVLRRVWGLGRDAQLLQELEHQVHTAGGEPAKAPGLYYFLEDDLGEGGLLLARPFLPGHTLSQRLRDGPVPLGAALRICDRLLESLGALHDQGLTHGNLSPGNVILGRGSSTGRVELVDVGLPPLPPQARGATAPDQALAWYISPEQAGLLEAAIGPASDLYQVGTLLFYTLTGTSPFEAPSFNQALRKHLDPQRPSLRRLGLDVPHALDQVLLRLLRVQPEDRYQTVPGVRADLRAVQEALEHPDAEMDLAVGGQDRRRTLTDPAFIARWDELEALEAGLRTCETGSGGLFVLEAVSGGGKTRLIQEVTTRALPERIQVYQGQGLQHEAQRPFEAIRGVVHKILDLHARSPQAIRSLAARLGDAAEAVCEAFPELAGPLGQEGSMAVGPEEFGEERTLDALVSLLDALGTPTEPAVVVLDDCQWADE